MLQEDDNKVTKDGLARILNFLHIVLPVLIQSILFLSIEFTHGSLTDFYKDQSHNFVRVVHQDLSEHLKARELLDEPPCTGNIFIDMAFQVPAHIR